MSKESSAPAWVMSKKELEAENQRLRALIAEDLRDFFALQLINGSSRPCPYCDAPPMTPHLVDCGRLFLVEGGRPAVDEIARLRVSMNNHAEGVPRCGL